MVAGHACLFQCQHSLFVHQAEGGADLYGGMLPEVAHGVAYPFQQSRRRSSPADDKREAADALCLVQAGHSQAFVLVYQVVHIGLGVVMGGLGAPFAVFRTPAGAGIDDGAEVGAAFSHLLGDVVCGFVEGFPVLNIGQEEGFIGSDVSAGEDTVFQFVQGHNIVVLGLKIWHGPVGGQAMKKAGPSGKISEGCLPGIGGCLCPSV